VDWQIAARVALGSPGGDDSPWSDAGGWRLGARARRDVRLRSGEWQRTVSVDFARGAADVRGVRTFRAEEAIHVFRSGRHLVFRAENPYLPASDGVDRHAGLTAPMPGRVIAVLVKAGDRVSRGAPLIVMEAMKMEHTITAPADSVVDKILCADGDQVKEGVELLVLS
jgi:3-methylcrotonyl-CoA carboxylase alpha subunit